MPVLENLRPVLHNLDPFLQFTGEYVPELQAFFANLTAASQAQGFNGSLERPAKGPKQHYLTTMAVLSPESLAIYPQPHRHRPRQPLPAAGRLRASSPAACRCSARAAARTPPRRSAGPANETISKS